MSSCNFFSKREGVLSNGRLFYTEDRLTVCVFFKKKIRVNMQRKNGKKVVKNLRIKRRRRGRRSVCCVELLNSQK